MQSDRHAYLSEKSSYWQDTYNRIALKYSRLGGSVVLGLVLYKNAQMRVGTYFMKHKSSNDAYIRRQHVVLNHANIG